MFGKNKLIDGLALTAVLTFASAVARRGTEETWTFVAGKEPPKDQSNRDVRIGEAVTWALLSGTVVGLTRLAIRRGIVFRGPLGRSSK